MTRESWAGIEPAHGGFAVPSVTASPPGRDFGTAYSSIFVTLRQKITSGEVIFCLALQSRERSHRYVVDGARHSRP